MKKFFSMVLFGLLTGTAFAGGVDKREVLLLTEEQRALVLEEMRGLLSGTQQILVALAKNDMAAVAKQARALGVAMAHKSEDHLKGALPPTFMQLGMAVHQDFDRIAADAETVKDPKHALAQLGESMSKCNACHASYQIRTPTRFSKLKAKP